MTLEERAAQLSQAEIVALLQQQEWLQARNADLERQNEWFKRQLFGRKSERRLLAPDAQQLPLAGILPTQEEPADAPPPTETVAAYQRRTRYSELPGREEESRLRFDASVPVQEIMLPNPQVANLAPDAYEVMGEKVTYRLAQRPGAYVVLKYVRPVVKLKETQAIHCARARGRVREESSGCESPSRPAH